MPSLSILFTAALLATSAVAAPTKQLSKRGVFNAFVKPRASASRNPRHELTRTYAKYNWDVIVVDPDTVFNPFASLDEGYGGSGGYPGSGPSSPSASVAPSYTTYTTVTLGSPTSTPESPAPFGNSTSTSAAPSGTASPFGTASFSGSAPTGKVSAVPEENDQEYLSPVQIGTGPQTLVLDFDTGSSDLWVFSSKMNPSDSQGHSVFDPSRSSTWQDYEGGSWEIQYGDNSGASGTVGFDRVSIGNTVVEKQAVELADQISPSFSRDANNDGLVGLGFSVLNTVKPQPQKTFFENIQHQLAEPLFTADLKDDVPGTYTFGTIDSTQYTGEVHYTPVDTSNGFWLFDWNSYSIGGTTHQCSNCTKVVADTGTSLLMVDTNVVDAYYAQVSGASMDSTLGGFVYPCSATLPSFGISVGDFMATIPGDAITYAEVKDGQCFGGIQSNLDSGISIAGDMFLKQFLAVFDSGNVRFGVANKAA